MNNPVGYLLKHKDGLYGFRGTYYDYVLAGNGLFIEAENNLMAARIPVSEVEVRGLAPLDPKIVLRHGKIPQSLFDLALSTFMLDTSKERYAAIVWTGEYHIVVPNQAESEEQLNEGDIGRGCAGRVSYLNPDNAILDLHSHGKIPAIFSSQDNRDETGLRLYGIVGDLNHLPVVNLRVGVYGYYYTIPWSDVFNGCLNGATEVIRYDLELIEDSEGKLNWVE